MWVFASSGMAMPALIPPTVLSQSRAADIKEARERGWELQVRGRVREHLEYWCETFMPEDSYSKVYASPGKDYNFRYYCSREAYGESLKRQAMAIDYTKFKDTSERFTWGRAYHALLLKVWAASTMLGTPYHGDGTGKFSSYMPKGRKRGNPRKQAQLFTDPYDDYAPGGYDDLPEELTRAHRSIHELTDADLERMWNDNAF